MAADEPNSNDNRAPGGENQDWTRISILAALLLAACSDPYVRAESWLVCDDVREKLEAFTLRCIEGANPKSDEEPEDWIGQCHTMARSTWCRDIGGFRWVKGSGDWGPVVPCTSARVPAELAVCPPLEIRQ